jgi:hypothetical protein
MAARITAEHDLSSTELSLLEDRLNGYNRRVTGRDDDDQSLTFVSATTPETQSALPPAIPGQAPPSSS